MAVVYYGLAVERDTIDRRPLFIESDRKIDSDMARSLFIVRSILLKCVDDCVVRAAERDGIERHRGRELL